MKAMPKRKVVGLLAGLLLAFNVALALSQSSGALPLGLGNRFLGPNMLRAEIVVKVGGSYHDYLLDNGRIRNLNAGTSLVTLVEKDGKVVSVPVAPNARITLNGTVVPFSSLRRGLRAMTIRDGNAPADTVQAFTR
jgi:hypothetical protein